MKILITESKDCGVVDRQSLSIDEKHIVTVGDLSECPEDAIIGRDLIDCHQIVCYMRKAYDAGINSESFEVETIEGEI